MVKIKKEKRNEELVNAGCAGAYAVAKNLKYKYTNEEINQIVEHFIIELEGIFDDKIKREEY